MATLGSELGLQEMCYKLLPSFPPAFSPYPPAPLSPFPLISQVCSLPALPNTVGKRSIKAAFAAVSLTLLSHPQIFGALIPKLNKPIHLVSGFNFFVVFD